jgi:23S rRNA (cytosine1962-C5)-methyltransferase
MTRVILLPRRARPFFARHPWVFAGSIARVDGRAEPGDEVAVLSHEGQFVARGLFNPHSAIRVRLYRWDDAPLDDDFWRAKIDAAVSLRTDVLKRDEPESACRMVFSEADGLSGLTVDRYDRWLVAQFTSLALHRRKDALIGMLMERTSAEGVVLKVDRAIADQEGLPKEEGSFVGTEPPEGFSIVENGLRFAIDLRSGQKTGFYLDQRDNRAAVARYAGGRRLLDLFCYTGGFALNALKNGGATHALGFDSSAPAIDAARANAVANAIGSARFEVSDVFDALEKIRARGERFGLVVCDPPKFARGNRDIEEAVKGYLRLNRLAVDAVEPGGVLATCSCSGKIDRTTFANVLAQASELSGRPIQILESRGPAADHPVSVSCPETDYFKCLICRVG